MEQRAHSSGSGMFERVSAYQTFSNVKLLHFLQSILTIFELFQFSFLLKLVLSSRFIL